MTYLFAAIFAGFIIGILVGILIRATRDNRVEAAQKPVVTKKAEQWKIYIYNPLRSSDVEPWVLLGLSNFSTIGNLVNRLDARCYKHHGPVANVAEPECDCIYLQNIDSPEEVISIHLPYPPMAMTITY